MRGDGEKKKKEIGIERARIETERHREKSASYRASQVTGEKEKLDE